jgi:phage host-nuclease inhibitor protein Gam
MSKSRTKITATPIKTREEMERLVGEITELQVRRQKYTAEMNGRITQIRAEYEAANATIDQELEARLALARDWAEVNIADFGKAKSLVLTHGVVGWRTGQPTLKTLKGFTWDKVLERLRTIVNFSAVYVRRKEEVNRAKLIEDREILGAEALQMIGVQVVQEETFFVASDIEAPEPKAQEVA